MLYHPTVIDEKREDIRLSMVRSNKKQDSKFEEAVACYENNIDCEKEIMKQLKSQLGEAFDQNNNDYSMAGLKVFESLKVKYLSGFYRCRVQEDLKERIKLPTNLQFEPFSFFKNFVQTK